MRQTLSLLAHLGRDCSHDGWMCIIGVLSLAGSMYTSFLLLFFLLTTFVFGHKKKMKRTFYLPFFLCSQLRGATKNLFFFHSLKALETHTHGREKSYFFDNNEPLNPDFIFSISLLVEMVFLCALLISPSPSSSSSSSFYVFFWFVFFSSEKKQPRFTRRNRNSR